MPSSREYGRGKLQCERDAVNGSLGFLGCGCYVLLFCQVLCYAGYESHRPRHFSSLAIADVRLCLYRNEGHVNVKSCMFMLTYRLNLGRCDMDWPVNSPERTACSVPVETPINPLISFHE